MDVRPHGCQIEGRLTYLWTQCERARTSGWGRPVKARWESKGIEDYRVKKRRSIIRLVHAIVRIITEINGKESAWHEREVWLIEKGARQSDTEHRTTQFSKDIIRQFRAKRSSSRTWNQVAIHRRTVEVRIWEAKNRYIST